MFVRQKTAMFNMYHGCHIFLTGEKHVGKSTLINKALEKLGVEYSGLKSVSVFDEDKTRRVYLVPAEEKNPQYKDLAGVCSCHHITEQHPEIFDSVGCTLITPKKGVELLVIDEIGRMEAEASKYKEKIISLLDRKDIVVLGVLQDMADEDFKNRIKDHPNVKTFVIKEANRDNLVPVLIRLLKFEKR